MRATRIVLRLWCLLCLALAAATPALADRTNVLQAVAPPAGGQASDVAFFGYDPATGKSHVLNPALVDRRFAPYSTFKIPNFLIALESGIVSSPAQVRAWDSVRRPRESHWPAVWEQDHSLASAFRASAVWYYRDLAQEIGTDRYRTFLSRFGYGNQSVPAESDDFWLDGSLAISPREQVRFLRNLHAGRLGLDPRNLAELTRASLLSEKKGFALHGKTGAGPVDPSNLDGSFEGWLVGWLERPAKPPFFYALYTVGPHFSAIAGYRRTAVEALLKQAGALPPTW